MVTVPDDLDRKDTRIVVDLNQAFTRPLHRLVLFLHVVGRNLPVGFRLGQVRLVDPRATLVSKITVNIVACPAHHDQDWKSWSILQSVLSFNLLNEFPNLVIDGAEALAPLQARIHRSDL
jgi:hypothetical protein